MLKGQQLRDRRLVHEREEWLMKRVSFLLSLALAGALPATAQVPKWSFEVAAGSGPRTEHTGSVYYVGDRTSVIRFALGYRVGPARRIVPHLTLEAGPNLAGDKLAICRATPNGTCREDFADNGAFGVGVGAKMAVLPRFLVGAQVGGGAYGPSARAFVEGNAAVRLGSHVALASTIRYMRWTQDGNAHWFSPLTLGVQFF
jgi:hypothetical protein